MKRVTRMNVLFAVAALAPAGACTSDQAPFNRLTGLRVLAIQSEPAAPATGETATLSALVFTPTDDPTLTYLWEWCPFPGPSGAGEGYPCLVSHDEIAMFGQVPSFELGKAPTAMLPNTVDPAALATLCAGVPGAPAAPDCAGGFPIQIKVTVTTETDKVVAVVTGHWRFSDMQPPNTNPTIPDDPTIPEDGLTATIDGVPQAMGDVPAFALRRDAATPVRAEVPDAASEWYDGFDDDGIPALLRERMFLTWFIETGDTDDARTSFIEGRTPFEDLKKNSWTPALKKNYGPGTARLIVVVHDNRGGVGWRSGIVNLDEMP